MSDHRLDRVTLTGVTVSVESGVFEALDCVSLHPLCPSDRLVGIREPKAQRRAVKRRRHDHDLRVVDRPAKRCTQTISGNRLARDHQDLHDIPPLFAREQGPFRQHVGHPGASKYAPASTSVAPVRDDSVERAASPSAATSVDACESLRRCDGVLKPR
jgi:hypothetical protein